MPYANVSLRRLIWKEGRQWSIKDVIIPYVSTVNIIFRCIFVVWYSLNGAHVARLKLTADYFIRFFLVMEGNKHSEVLFLPGADS